MNSPTKAELQARIADLELELALAHEDRAYLCLTRVGLERRCRQRSGSSAQLDTIIFFDLDGMHALNESLGYEEVDRRIAASLPVSSRCIVGRWYSGDELVALSSRADAQGWAIRIQEDLARNGLSATFCIARHTGQLQASVLRAAERVQAAKAGDERGGIFDIG